MTSIYLGPIISKTAGDKDLVTSYNVAPIGNSLLVANGHVPMVPDDVM